MQSDKGFLSGALATRVFLSFAAGYFLSYALRAVSAVIAPVLLADLQLSNADLGLLSSAYLVTFACLQLPLGIWLDKYGARRTEAGLLLVAAVGTMVFAASESLTGLWIGRALIGAGVSACLMAPLKAFRQWFAPERQSQLAGWMLFAGTAGAMSATIPVTMAIPLVGWRGVFWITSAMLLMVSAAIFFFLKEAERVLPVAAVAPDTASASQPTDAPGAAPKFNYGTIFRDRHFRRLTIAGAVSQGSFIALQTLWAGPWLMTVTGLGKDQASQVLFVFNLALMLSYLALSWWAPRLVAQGNRPGWPATTVIAMGLSAGVMVQVAMLIFTGAGSWMLWVVLALFAPTVTLAQTQVSLAFPHALAGRANSAYNLTVFIVAFSLQWGMGLVIDMFRNLGFGPADAMRVGLGLCIATQLMALLAFAMYRSQRTGTTILS